MQVDMQVQVLYDEGMKLITSSAEHWKAICRMTGNLYRYEFDNILMVYMQRPNATLVADYDTWKDKRVGRYVKRGSKGIAIFPSRALNPRMRYVFDIEDTGGRKSNLTWEINDENREFYAKRVGKKADSNLSTENFLQVFTEHFIHVIMDTEFEERINELNHLAGTKRIIVDDKTQEITAEEALVRSVVYAVFTRCGIDISPEKQDFSFITAFQSEEEVYRLGSLVSDISCETLRAIAYEVMQTERSIANAKHNELPRGTGRDVVPEPDTADRRNERDESREIRTQGDGALKGESQPEIPYTREVRETDTDASRSGDAGKRDDGDIGVGLSEEEPTEEPRVYDGDVAASSTSEDAGRRNRDEGSRSEVPLEETERQEQLNKKLNEELKTIESPYETETGSFEQASFSFDLNGDVVLPKQHDYMNPQTEHTIPHEYVEQILLENGPRTDSKKKILEIFETVSNPNERATKIKEIYGVFGRSSPIDGYGLHGYDASPGKGIRIRWIGEEGEKEGYLSWKAVERELGVLIMTGIFRQRFAEHEREEPLRKESMPEELPQTEATLKELPQEVVPSNNFHFATSELPKGGPKVRYGWNVEAIRLLKQIEREDRPSTLEEQAILARYVGWGGISQAFDERNTTWKKEYEELKELLRKTEYEEARETVTTAFYTSPAIIEAIYQGLSQFGFQKGTILEPSMGIGHFFGAMPEEMLGSSLYGVEKDGITGRIAKLLYPDAKIQVKGFENTQFSDNFFDVAVGNIPFGDFKVYDSRYNKFNFRIHDYFIAKTLDKVRPGGIVAFVASKFVMDKANSKVRKYLAERAELLGAIRLPDTAFLDSAGTSVTSDILFFQKRERKIVAEPDWIHLGQTENGIAVNSYFAVHPEMMLGTMEYVEGRYGQQSNYTSCVNHNEDFDLGAELKAAVSRIQGQITTLEDVLDEQEERGQAKDILDADPDVKNYTFTFVEGKLYYRDNSKMYRREVSATVERRIKLLDELRMITRELIQIQMAGCSEEELRTLQGMLNEKYDVYVKDYGYLTGRGISMAFRDDADYPLLCSLEVVDEDGHVEKADMFFKQTIRPKTQIDYVETATEALNVSVSERGKVDIPFMLQLYEPDISEAMKDLPEGSTLSAGAEVEVKKAILLEELKGLIFLDPREYNENDLDKGWKTADEYLSGNVREKLRLAKQYAQRDAELFGTNVEALVQAQPKDLDASEIEVRIGTTWIEREDYEAFIYELLDTPKKFRAGGWKQRKDCINIQCNPYAQTWYIENKSLDKGSVAASKTYGTSRIDAYSILEETLNLRTVTIRDAVEDANGNVTYVVNKRETMIAREKQNQMKEAFRSWIFKDQERRQKYVDYYNQTFNCIRLRSYDGSFLKFPGMSPEVQLREHQKNAVARILLGGNTLLAHVVGAGKTFTMMAACMEQKRLGLANKNVIIVPKSLIGQTAGEFMRLYPSANILVATQRDFEKSRRKQFVSRIATGDYDCIIMSHSQFEKIPISEVRKARILTEQIEEISDAISSMKAKNEERWTVKQMESQKKRLEQQLKAMTDESRKDDLISFEELGIDSIMVDEAHHFKNLAIFSKMHNVAGISGAGSQKAMDMLLKCQYLTEQNGNRGIVFATGTPVSNTMCELYVMQTYLQKDTLERMGIHHFDSWATNFGEVTTALELTVEGSGFRFKSRFNKFVNLPELMTIFREVADVQTADMLNLPVPKLKGDKFIIVDSEPDDYVKQVMEDFVVRAEKIRGGGVDPSEDNFLKITHEARLLGTDARLLDLHAPNNPDGKLNKVVENVTAEYFQNNTDGNIGCQLVFSDIGTPKAAWSEDWLELFEQGERTFDVYNYIKTELVKRGIPAEEIAFIHDAKSDAQRENLFRDMRSGKKRILIGSTDQCGTGVNVQKHLVAMHHVDCPWKPGSIEQRDGRGLRQGNENEEVAVYRYVTKGTFDAYSWNIIENKHRFISQIMTSKAVSRTCEDIDEIAFSYAEIKAVATGNPLIKEKMELENDVQRLKILKNGYDSQRFRLEDNILVYYPKVIKAAMEKLTCVQEDIKQAEEALLKEPDFSITIQGVKYEERANGGQALLDELIKNKTVGEAIPIGTFKGFELLIEKRLMGAHHMILKGKSEYRVEISMSSVGNMVKLENLMANIKAEAVRLTGKIEEYQRDLEQSKTEYEKPFEHEMEFVFKTTRLNELNVQLDLENGRVEDVDLTPQGAEQIAEEPTYNTKTNRNR